ncbi:bcl-2-like protein 1 [Watersipora subatra]|uniref:bcl-2-like protein 1 n=1 Tax=Watersipora subatra TaxID=2589382 RepID=UPI00355ADEF1
MTHQNTRSITRDLVKDFVYYRLQKAGYNDLSDSDVQNISTASASLKRTLRMMGDEFTNAYFQAFDDMTSSINIHGDDLHEVLLNIFNVTCDSGIEYGRIVGIFVFTALLAVKARDCNRTDVVENLIYWTGDYLEGTQFSNWINQHGGWDGFIQFYKSPKARHQEQFWAQAYTVGINVFNRVASIANIFMH